MQVTVTAVIVLVYFVLDRFSTPRIKEGVDQSRFKADSAENAILIARFLTGLVGMIVLVLVWGIDVGSIVVLPVLP